MTSELNSAMAKEYGLNAGASVIGIAARINLKTNRKIKHYESYSKTKRVSGDDGEEFFR